MQVRAEGLHLTLGRMEWEFQKSKNLIYSVLEECELLRFIIILLEDSAHGFETRDEMIAFIED